MDEKLYQELLELPIETQARYLHRLIGYLEASNEFEIEIDSLLVINKIEEFVEKGV